MATFNLEEGSIRSEGGKTFIMVTFKAADGRSSTEHYEVESIDNVAIERTLQAAADEFEARVVAVPAAVSIQTGKDLTFVEPVVKEAPLAIEPEVVA